MSTDESLNRAVALAETDLDALQVTSDFLTADFDLPADARKRLLEQYALAVEVVSDARDLAVAWRDGVEGER